MGFRRQLETFDASDMPVAAQGRNGEVDGIWFVLRSTLHDVLLVVLTSLANPVN